MLNVAGREEATEDGSDDAMRLDANVGDPTAGFGKTADDVTSGDGAAVVDVAAGEADAEPSTFRTMITERSRSSCGDFDAAGLDVEGVLEEAIEGAAFKLVVGSDAVLETAPRDSTVASPRPPPTFDVEVFTESSPRLRLDSSLDDPPLPSSVFSFDVRRDL